MKCGEFNPFSRILKKGPEQDALFLSVLAVSQGLYILYIFTDCNVRFHSHTISPQVKGKRHAQEDFYYSFPNYKIIILYSFISMSKDIMDFLIKVRLVKSLIVIREEETTIQRKKTLCIM